jgi:hypothetical protein
VPSAPLPQLVIIALWDIIINFLQMPIQKDSALLVVYRIVPDALQVTLATPARIRTISTHLIMLKPVVYVVMPSAVAVFVP